MTDQATRKQWMAVLAKADVEELEKATHFIVKKMKYYFLRPPETGLIMVRAKIGGTGRSFHLGEMTVTRCTIQIKNGFRGTAYVMGRNKRHAELAAILDALLQDPSQHTSLMDSVIHPLRDSLQKRKERLAQKIATTRVEFFTMVRGDET